MPKRDNLVSKYRHREGMSNEYWFQISFPRVSRWGQFSGKKAKEVVISWKWLQNSKLYTLPFTNDFLKFKGENFGEETVKS